MQYLESLGLSIKLAKQGTLSVFEQAIELGLPVIVNVQTVGWPHWHGEVTYHAVVVTGIDPIAETVYLHDPFFAEAPLVLALNTFLIGWEEQDRQYAVIALAPIG